MTGPASGGGATEIRVVAHLDRRRAEMLALALRQRLRQLGLDDAQLTIRTTVAAPAAPPR